MMMTTTTRMKVNQYLYQSFSLLIGKTNKIFLSLITDFQMYGNINTLDLKKQLIDIEITLIKKEFLLN
jgi:hypothetical protein